MDIQIFTALVLFCFTATITPGPNNLLLASSGLNFGLRATLPLMLGIMLGFATLTVLIGSGLGTLMQQHRGLSLALKIGGVSYMLYLALMIARSPPANPDSPPSKPGFLHGFLLQALNPKAWMMALTGLAAFSTPGDHYWNSVFVVVLGFLLIGLPAHLLWIGLGQAIAINDNLRHRTVAINKAMALAMIVTAALLVTYEI